ncbi:MAG: fibronectin type III domain-containing protein [Candidatus Microsaccharimonas sp.]
MSMSKRGFTLVELVVVIAVIGILAAITLIGFSRYQADGRDARRVSSVSAITEALEKYYDQNGEYPSCSQITAIASTVTSSTLPGLSSNVLVAPQATTGTTNSIQCGATLTINGVDFFSYSGDGSAACNGSISCINYSISYKNESDGTITTVTSRRNTALATSGAATLSTGTLGFTTAGFSWTSVQNAANYTLQVATTSNFTGGTYTEYPVTSATTTTATSLTAATNYWARVRPTNAVGDGLWSNVLPFTTNDIAAPVVTTTSISNSQINVTWGAVTNADTYTLQYSLNAGMSSPITITGIAGTSYSLTGLATGTTYYIQVRGISNSPYSGPWSAIVNNTTILPAPVCIASTLNSNTQITVSWNASAGALSYTLDYALDSGFTSPTSLTGIAGTNRAVTGLNNGTTYYFRVKGVNGSAPANWGLCPSATTGVSGPSSTGWTVQPYAVRSYASLSGLWMPGQDPGYGSTWWTVGMSIYGTCSPGATVVTRLYSYYAYSNNTSANDTSLMDWTWNNQVRYVVGGSDSWYVWWQGWVACQVGGSRAGDTYLGNAGGY